MKVKSLLVMAFLVAFLGGCATPPQTPVALNKDAISTKSRIGVAMMAVPKPDTYLLGAGCLLCYAAASIANSDLTDYTHTLSNDDVVKYKDSVVDLLKKQGADVVVIADPLNPKDFQENSSAVGVPKLNLTSLKDKYKIDRVLVINVTALGFLRTYANYFPTSDPKALVEGSAYIVDLSKNAYDWYLPFSVTKAADGKWDEPKQFPGLTNSFYQVVETGRDYISKPFSN